MSTETRKEELAVLLESRGSSSLVNLVLKLLEPIFAIAESGKLTFSQADESMTKLAKLAIAWIGLRRTHGGDDSQAKLTAIADALEQLNRDPAGVAEPHVKGWCQAKERQNPEIDFVAIEQFAETVSVRRPTVLGQAVWMSLEDIFSSEYVLFRFQGRYTECFKNTDEQRRFEKRFAEIVGDDLVKVAKTTMGRPGCGHNLTETVSDCLTRVPMYCCAFTLAGNEMAVVQMGLAVALLGLGAVCLGKKKGSNRWLTLVKKCEEICWLGPDQE